MSYTYAKCNNCVSLEARLQLGFRANTFGVVVILIKSEILYIEVIFIILEKDFDCVKRLTSMRVEKFKLYSADAMVR